VGGKDKSVVEGTVTSTPAELEGEIVTGFVAGTVMMVCVFGGVIIGVNDVGFVGKLHLLDWLYHLDFSFCGFYLTSLYGRQETILPLPL